MSLAISLLLDGWECECFGFRSDLAERYGDGKKARIQPSTLLD